jgi:hypothetical protein
MVNKKIKAVKDIKTPKAPRQPRAPRAQRQPAQPKKAPTQNVYIYSGGQGGQPQVYSNQAIQRQQVPTQFYQQPIENPMMNLVTNQNLVPPEPISSIPAPNIYTPQLERRDKVESYTLKGLPVYKQTDTDSLFSKLYVEPKSVETQTEIAEEDMLERPEPSQTASEIAIIPSKPVEEESLFSELFFTPQSVNELESQRSNEPINWFSFNPDYNMTEGELDYQTADAERRYREQQRYLGEIKDTPARAEGNILLFPEQQQNELQARVEPIGEQVQLAEPRPIRTRPIEIKPVRYDAEEELIIYPEFQAEQKEVIQRPPKREVIQSDIQPEVKPQIKPVRYEAEEEIVEQPIFQAPKKEVIQRPPKREVIQPVLEKTPEEQSEEEIKQEIAKYERLMSKTKEFEKESEPAEKIYKLGETPQELGQRADAVPEIQAEVSRNPVGRPKKGEDFEPQPDLELTPEEEGIRMALYNDLTRDRKRDELANLIKPFLQENPWANELRDENGEKIARTSETLKDKKGNAIKNKKGTGDQQRDFNKQELKSILDKLVREKIKRERFVK